MSETPKMTPEREAFRAWCAKEAPLSQNPRCSAVIEGKRCRCRAKLTAVQIRTGEGGSLELPRLVVINLCAWHFNLKIDDTRRGASTDVGRPDKPDAKPSGGVAKEEGCTPCPHMEGV